MAGTIGTEVEIDKDLNLEREVDLLLEIQEKTLDIGSILGIDMTITKVRTQNLDQILETESTDLEVMIENMIEVGVETEITPRIGQQIDLMTDSGHQVETDTQDPDPQKGGQMSMVESTIMRIEIITVEEVESLPQALLGNVFTVEARIT